MYRLCNVFASEGEIAAARVGAAAARHGAEREPAVLLLDAARRLLSISPGAAALIDESALEIVFGMLAAREQSAAHQLDAAFRTAAGGGASVTLTLGEHELQLVPLLGRGERADIIVTIRRLAEDRGQRLHRVAARFGLTPAESRLLDALCGGASLSQASARLGVARTTARTHLQRIFDKSGTHRQAELVGMVFGA